MISKQTTSLLVLLAVIATGRSGQAAGAADEVGLDLEGIGSLEGLSATGGSSTWLELRQLKGFVSTEGRFYLDDAPGNRGQLISEVQAELDLRLFGELGLLLRPRLLIDALHSSLYRYEPLEAYLTVGGGGWSLRAGQFIDNWGIADAFNPLDLLNRRDLGAEMIDPPALGELGARLQLFLPDSGTVGEPTLSFYLMPLTRGAVFPTRHQRFSLDQTGIRLAEDAEVRPRAANGILGAVRLSHTLSTGPLNADLQYVVARGPARFPALVARPAENGPELVPQYFGAWTFGGGLRAVPNAAWWSKLTFKLELVYQLPYRLDGVPETLPDDYLQYVVGLDRIFSGALRSTDQLTVTVEYLAEHLANDAQANFRPFEHDLALRLYWEAGNFSRSEVELRGIVDLASGEVVAEASYEQQLRLIHDDLRLRLSAQVFRPDRDGQRLFALFPNNSNFRGELRFDF